MLKLLRTSHLRSIRCRLSKTPATIQLDHYLSPPPECRFSLHSTLLYHLTLIHDFPSLNYGDRNFASRDCSSSSETRKDVSKETECRSDNASRSSLDEDDPNGDFEFTVVSGWNRFVRKLRMLFAFPRVHIEDGSVLSMKLRGRIHDQLHSPFMPGLSLPQICENFIKAAHDPRISGIYLHIEPLNCGWGKVEEIRRHILNFKKSGKFIVAYTPVCREKEYYIGCCCEELYAPPSAYFSLYGLNIQSSFLGGVLAKVGIEPQVQKVGKYKSVGDQLTRKTMSEENREMLTGLLDTIYGNWLDKVSIAKGRESNFLFC